MKAWLQGHYAVLTSEDAIIQRQGLRTAIGLILFGFLIGFALGMSIKSAHAQEEPVMLVAAPELGGYYAGTVLVAAPWEGGHIGVILNRPTQLKLADLYPDHAPSAAVRDPLHTGGPAGKDIIVALVKSELAPSAHAVAMGPGVWWIFQVDTIDHVIETTPNEARFFNGAVWWNAGELAEEVRQGMFTPRPVDPAKLFQPDTSQLYEQLAPKAGEVGT